MKIIIGGLIGGAIGFLYGRFIGCKTGMCPLTGNYYISTIVGIIFGMMIASGGSK
ncbi:MAG: DUF6132 family protein [Elusimicrobiota bacterium]